MRVLFLSQIVPYPPHGGVLQRGYNIVRELGRRADVHLMAFVHPDALPTAAALEESRAALAPYCTAIEYFSLWPKVSRAHGLAALAISAVNTRPFSVVAHRSKAFAGRVEAAMANSHFDVLHVDTIGLSEFADARTNVPSVLTHHNIESVLMERRAAVEKRPLARAFLRREAAKLSAYERAVAPTFALNIVVSGVDERVLHARVPGVSTAVVPNGVDTNYFAGGESSETATLIYTGGMNMFANRDAVIYFLTEIWPTIRKRIPTVRFTVVGQDPPPELIRISEQDPSVVVTGFVPDIRPLVAGAAVYIVPLRVGGGTRLKVLDAMAMSKAMVSTSVGCEGIDVVPGRDLLTADTPGDFAAAVVALLEDDGRRRALGDSARRLVESRYSWPTVADSLMEAYRRAVVAP